MAFENTLLREYDRILVFDTETTGLDYRRDEIIQFAGAVISLRDGHGEVTETYDNLVQLSPGGYVSSFITGLTGITAKDLREKGLSKARICCDIAHLVEGNTLLVAYNAQFDLSFVYFMLLRSGDPDILKGKAKLDALTVFRDRRPYPQPHKLSDAIDVYCADDGVQNSHRALDDVLATCAVLAAMDEEKEDLLQYVNLFGSSTKNGSVPISSVTYRKHKFGVPLYEA